MLLDFLGLKGTLMLARHTNGEVSSRGPKRVWLGRKLEKVVPPWMGPSQGRPTLWSWDRVLAESWLSLL